MKEECKKAIIDLLEERDGTICPSEAARAVREDNWREIMPEVIRALEELVDSEKVVVKQSGETVDLEEAEGPVRIDKA